MDDWGLIERARSGDGAAFELLVRRHTDAVWRAARGFLRDDFAAEEVVQDTFLKAYRALDSFRGEAAVRTWLVSICHRSCVDRSRRRQAEIVSLEHARRHRAKDDATDLRMAIEAALPSLPEDERRAFVLVDVLGYSREEAAEVAGAPSSTIRSRLARARRRLLEALGEGDEVEGLA
jgi:RNA polymerase sigma-70 factor (ECF subfamily)